MCAATLRHWCEGATLMVARCSRKLDLRRPVDSACRSSPAARKSTRLSPKSDLELLFLKRSSNVSFVPDLYTFPGGIADNSDFSKQWRRLFDATTPEAMASNLGFSKTLPRNPPIFLRQREQQFSYLPSEIAFRICAIRETFKASGILIARSVDYNSFHAETYATFSHVFNNKLEKEKWQKKVAADPSAFLALCEHFDIVPDVWSLFNWANWLTPVLHTREDGNQRVDAAFFICCLQDHPYPPVHDDKCEWSGTSEIIHNFNRHDVQLLPPQLYEISRLVNFANEAELVEFLKSRIKLPLERLMPVRLDCADAIIFAFPGDSMYPEHPDYTGEAPLRQRVESLKKLTPPSAKLHRAVIGLPLPGQSVDNLRLEIQCNIQLPGGHVAPYTD